MATNRALRNNSVAVEDVIHRVDRRMDVIHRIIRVNLSMNQLAQCRNKLLSLNLNFKCLQLTTYAITFRNKMLEMPFALQVEDMKEPGQGGFSTTISTNNNERTESTAALTSDINDENIILVEDNEASASVTEKRFIIDKNRLEHLFSLGFTVRKIARDRFLGKHLHHNTLHNLMERNQMTSIRNRYTSLADDERRHKI